MEFKMDQWSSMWHVLNWTNGSSGCNITWSARANHISSLTITYTQILMPKHGKFNEKKMHFIEISHRTVQILTRKSIISFFCCSKTNKTIVLIRNVIYSIRQTNDKNRVLEGFIIMPFVTLLSNLVT